MGMDKNYDPQEIEERWQRKWEEWEVFKFDKDSNKESFSIDTPPPTASGELHLGHANNYTEFEIIARAMRLFGYNVFFPVGYDDNGLPTEKYVEEEKGINVGDVGIQAFREQCRDAADEIEEGMTELFKKLGMSWDWSTLYRTIEDRVVKTSQKSFLDLYRQDDIYREEEPILWCPYHQTSLAQATVEDKDRHTKLNYLYFETEDGKIEIATTRPELLPSCVAVFVHPDDERYRDLVGRKAKVPLFDYEVPIKESEEVDPEFGSGIVMVCTFGDSSDVEMWKQHDLPLKVSIDEQGKMNERAGRYEGLSVDEARERIIEDLKQEGIIFDQEDIQQTVGVCWRCETPVEFVTTEQWFVETLKYTDKLLELGDKINWYPEYYKNRYRDWVENLKWDWCISRQRYYGVPVPVWYCEDCGKVVVPEEDELPVDPREEKPDKSCGNCGSSELTGDGDVMDTWMTSSMTPQVVGRWLDDEELFEEIFPMSMRPQSHDIIRTWAFYTILKSYLHNDSIPWEDIVISGYVYAEEGVGMSKSRGTGISPEDIIENEGADCLRYWTASTGTGEDIIYEEKEVKRGEKILTKLWNASRFVEMHLDDYEDEEAELEDIDRWLLTKLDEVLEDCEEHYRNYETSKVRRKMESFFLEVFCDNYLEMVKHRLYNPEEFGEKSKQAALRTLYQGLLASLKVFMPIIPHITEEIYHNIFSGKEDERSINETSWPVVGKDLTDESSKERGEVAKDMIEEVRRWKSDEGIPLNEDVPLVEVYAEEEDRERIRKMSEVIKGTINIQELSFRDPSEEGIEVQNQSVRIKPKETA